MGNLASIESGSPRPSSPDPQPPTSLDDPRLYLNRELSLLAFQGRVLEEAADPGNLLLERVKFLSILFSNLDEFFMVRVAVLKQKASSAQQDGTVGEQLEKIRAEVRRLLARAYEVWRDIELALVQSGIDILDYRDLDEPDRSAADRYFQEVVYPVLTPQAVDSARPFPHVSSLSLNLAVYVRDAEGEVQLARVKIPNTLPQLVSISKPLGIAGGRPTLVWLEQLIRANLTSLFPGLEIVRAHAFRVTRDAEVEIQELESDDLLETIEEAVWQRRFRAVVRMQVSHEMPQDILEVLLEKVELNRRDVYRVDGPIDLGRLMVLAAIDRPELKDAAFVPRTPPALMLKPRDDMFAALRREDILMHHPYDSFQPMVEFLHRAAEDPDVLAIKITLYRVGRNSPIVESLLRAIEHGKQVAVLVELKARFDEEPNIEWARALEAAGVHVVYGLVGLKVHSKVAMVVRREGHAIRRYIHLGTGNYNPATARLYTDLSLLTTDEAIGADVTDVFNYVTGYSAKREYNKLLVAPTNLRENMERLIRREIGHAQAGRPARLIFKMNSLEDKATVRLLYEASQAGVTIDLLVRGICVLRPGLEGISDNIRVISIVGRFLEHSRIYYFHNAGDEQVYLGSADLMGRNLDRRVEILFPIQNPKMIARLRGEILATYLADNTNARHMRSDGTYEWPGKHHAASGSDAEGNAAERIDSQAAFLSISRDE